MQPGESLYKLVDALVAHQSAYENKCQSVGLSDFFCFGLHIGKGRIVVGEVDSAHIAVAEHLQRLTGYAVVYEIVFNAFSLRYDMRSAGTCQTVGHHQNTALKPRSCREHEPCERVQSHRHPCHPCRHHRQ